MHEQIGESEGGGGGCRERTSRIDSWTTLIRPLPLDRLAPSMSPRRHDCSSAACAAASSDPRYTITARTAAVAASTCRFCAPFGGALFSRTACTQAEANAVQKPGPVGGCNEPVRLLRPRAMGLKYRPDGQRATQTHTAPQLVGPPRRCLR